MTRAHGRRRRVGWAAVAVAVVVLAVPALASAWSQTYVSSTYFYPDGIGLSAFNGSLNYNAMSWDPPYDPGGQAGPQYGLIREHIAGQPARLFLKINPHGATRSPTARLATV